MLRLYPGQGFAHMPPPALDLNFSTGLADPRITFTRASAGGLTNSAGLYQSVAANAPRIDYDPVTRACKGLLIEEARTNLLLGSGQMTNPTYWVVGAALASFFTATTDALTAPDGTNGTVAKFVTGATTSGGLFARAGNLLPTNIYSGSLYIYVPTQSGVANWAFAQDFNDTESYTTAAQTTFDRWVLVFGSVSISASRSIVDFNIRRNGVAPTNGDGFTFYTWGAQLEIGAFATSYIPTVASQVTRAADVAVMTGTNFSSWYNQSEGTFVVESSTFFATQSPARQTVLVRNALGAFISLKNSGPSTATGLTVLDDALAVTADISSTVAVSGVANKIAAAYKANDFGISTNGEAASNDSFGALPTAMTDLGIGNDFGAVYQNGHIRNLRFFPQRLPNATLQALST